MIYLLYIAPQAHGYVHIFHSFFEKWSRFNKLKTPDQWLWTCKQCWVH